MLSAEAGRQGPWARLEWPEPAEPSARQALTERQAVLAEREREERRQASAWAESVGGTAGTIELSRLEKDPQTQTTYVRRRPSFLRALLDQPPAAVVLRHDLKDIVLLERQFSRLVSLEREEAVCRRSVDTNRR